MSEAWSRTPERGRDTSNPSYSADGNFEFWGATMVSGVDYPIEYRVYRA